MAQWAMRLNGSFRGQCGFFIGAKADVGSFSSVAMLTTKSFDIDLAQYQALNDRNALSEGKTGYQNKQQTILN